jgi:hypothetical protein
MQSQVPSPKPQSEQRGTKTWHPRPRTWNFTAIAIVAFTLLGTVCVRPAVAQKTKAVKETIEYVLEKFGREAAEEGAEKLAAKAEALALKHGDEVLVAFRKTGPRALKLIDEAGSSGQEAARLLANFGDDARQIVGNPARMSLAGKYGDEAVQAIIKHPEIAEPVVAAYGKTGAKAMGELGVSNGRRLAGMVDSGELAKLGRGEELLGVVGKYGERGMEFIYKHRKLLAGTAVLTAFLANPQPYIDGTLDLAKLAAENVVKPIAEIPQKVALKSMENPSVAWASAAVAGVLFCALCYCLFRIFLRPRMVAARLAEQKAAEQAVKASRA